jgi:hypothetical protein
MSTADAVPINTKSWALTAATVQTGTWGVMAFIWTWQHNDLLALAIAACAMNCYVWVRLWKLWI